MKGKLLLAGLLVLAIVLSGCLTPSNEELYACNSDNDCAIVEGDCGCSVAINKSYIDWWDSAKARGDYPFGGTVLCPETCPTGPARCLEGKCQLEYE